MKIWFFFITLLTAVSEASACFTAPSDYYRPYSQVIREADLIFLGRVKSIEEIKTDGAKTSTLKDLLDAASQPYEGNRRFEFEIVELLKGKIDEESIFIKGIDSQSGPIQDYNKHTDYQFWLDVGGRIKSSSNCLLLPNFHHYNEYLIIMGEKNSYKSYEVIRSSEDAWLKEVKLMLRLDQR